MSEIIISAAAPTDTQSILSLLERSKLPTAGLLDHLANALVARKADEVVGSAALEMYPNGALLRSVAVAASERGVGLGGRLTERALAQAKDRGVPAVYLLTTTARQFFPKFGFEEIARADVPADVRESIEFTSACPASAIAMRKRL